MVGEDEEAADSDSVAAERGAADGVVVGGGWISAMVGE